MISPSPLALFITWVVYSTFLPDDSRGWRHRRRGQLRPRPRLEEWHRERLNHDVVLLDPPMRECAQSALVEICTFRSWTQWASAVRSNHVHIVVTAPEYKPTLVRDQLKAKCTNELRQSFPVWRDRPVWAVKGDIEFLDTEDEIEQCVLYVTEAQDRKDREP